MAEGNQNYLDMNGAWTDAWQMLRSNISLVAVLVGIFVVLPYLAFALLAAERMDALLANSLGQPNPQALVDAYMAMLPLFLLIALASTIGNLALLNLLGHSSRPTVGQAIMNGLKAFLPAFAGNLLLGLGMALVIVLPLLIISALQVEVLTFIAFLIAFGAVVFFWIRLVLYLPDIAIGDTYNPIEALKNSWDMTKNNFWRIVLFFFLVGISLFVVGIVTMIIFALVFSVLGAEAAVIANGVMTSVIQGAAAAIFAAVYAATYRQLSGAYRGQAEVFE